MIATWTAPNWRAEAACLSADPDLFFPISSAGPAEKQIARAKRICAGCRVRRECLDFALSHDQVYGIWGGTTPEDRQRARRRKRRAAAAAARRAVAVLHRNPLNPTSPRSRCTHVTSRRLRLAVAQAVRIAVSLPIRRVAAARRSKEDM